MTNQNTKDEILHNHTYNLVPAFWHLRPVFFTRLLLDTQLFIL